MTIESLRPKEISAGWLAGFGHPVFTRYSAWKKIHPMSGGIWHVQRDSASDYQELRKRQFGFDLVPLPENLELSKADAELNRRVKIAI